MGVWGGLLCCVALMVPKTREAFFGVVQVPQLANLHKVEKSGEMSTS